MKPMFVLAVFAALLGTPVYAQIDQSLCMQCRASTREELKKCFEEAISQEDKKSCQEKQDAHAKTCENECKIEKAAQSGNQSEAPPAKK